MAHELSDHEAYERLHAALLALGREAAKGTAANTALTAARVALSAYQMALVAAIDRQPRLAPPPWGS